MDFETLLCLADVYSGYWIFWTGVLFYTTTAMVSTSVTFLMFDRIMVVLLPVGFRKHKKLFNFITILTIICVGLFIILSMVILELPVDELTCNNF